MAPLVQAINSEFAYEAGEKTVYRGQVDGEWTVMSVPHGGYINALMLDAVIKHQSGTPHPDPIHLTAHFMKSASVGPFEVHIKTLKVGRGFKNMSVNFVQNNEDKIMTHMIFGTLSSDETIPTPTLAPPSLYAVRTPMTEPPSRCIPASAYKLSPWTFRDRLKVVCDPEYFARLKSRGPQPGMKWGDYLSLREPLKQGLTPQMIAIFADIFMSPPLALPLLASHRVWLPTIVMTLEFKFPIPKLSDPNTAKRTVAVFSQGKFINNPGARHDIGLEVWTAPPDGDDATLPVSDDWKEHQRCLAVSTQMAVVVPVAVNHKRGAATKGKL